MCKYTAKTFENLKNHVEGLHPKLFAAVKAYIEGTDITASISEASYEIATETLPVDLWIRR